MKDRPQYVNTSTGPLQKLHSRESKVDELLNGAPEDMDTFLEVSNKLKELDSEIEALGGGNNKDWLATKVTTLPTASKDTLNKIYIDSTGGGHVTYNTGTPDNPVYSWTSLGSNASDLSNYYTKSEIDTSISKLSATISELSTIIKRSIQGEEDTTEAIDTIPEIIDFLKGYNNKETLKDQNSIEIENTTTDQYNDVFN